MSIEGQGHFFTIYFPGFVCFVLYLAKISGERLQDHWSSGFLSYLKFISAAPQLNYAYDNPVCTEAKKLNSTIFMTTYLPVHQCKT